MCGGPLQPGTVHLYGQFAVRCHGLLLSAEPAPQLLHGTCPPVNLLATGGELEPLEKLGRRGWNFGALP